MLFLLNPTSAFGIRGLFVSKYYKHMVLFVILHNSFAGLSKRLLLPSNWDSSDKFSIIYVQFVFIMFNLLYHVLLYMVKPFTPFTKLQELFYSDNNKFWNNFVSPKCWLNSPDYSLRVPRFISLQYHWNHHRFTEFILLS